NFDGRPMKNVSGITGAGPIFRAGMLLAMRGLVPAPLVDPTHLEEVSICPLSGERASPDCPGHMDEVFVRGTAPVHACTMHSHVSRQLEGSLASRCAHLTGRQGRVVDVGPAFYDWAKSKGLGEEPWLARLCRESLPAAQGAVGTKILFP